MVSRIDRIDKHIQPPRVTTIVIIPRDVTGHYLTEDGKGRIYVDYGGVGHQQPYVRLGFRDYPPLIRGRHRKIGNLDPEGIGKTTISPKVAVTFELGRDVYPSRARQTTAVREA